MEESRDSWFGRKARATLFVVFKERRVTSNEHQAKGSKVAVPFPELDGMCDVFVCKLEQLEHGETLEARNYSGHGTG